MALAILFYFLRKSCRIIINELLTKQLLEQNNSTNIRRNILQPSCIYDLLNCYFGKFMSGLIRLPIHMLDLKWLINVLFIYLFDMSAQEMNMRDSN
jgi:hypothetical protein